MWRERKRARGTAIKLTRGVQQRNMFTRWCALKRRRFESFCRISLVRALSPDGIIQTRMMVLLVVYWLHTGGFSFDRPLGLTSHSCITYKDYYHRYSIIYACSYYCYVMCHVRALESVCVVYHFGECVN